MKRCARKNALETLITRVADDGGETCFCRTTTGKWAVRIVAFGRETVPPIISRTLAGAVAKLAKKIGGEA